jgi:hypothetical protein
MCVQSKRYHNCYEWMYTNTQSAVSLCHSVQRNSSQVPLQLLQAALLCLLQSRLLLQLQVVLLVLASAALALTVVRLITVAVA